MKAHQVMVFVNQVSEIVHGGDPTHFGCASAGWLCRTTGICDTYHGSPNQNIGGNSFLVES